jgi:flagellar basal-body rod protein FlgC
MKNILDTSARLITKVACIWFLTMAGCTAQSVGHAQATLLTSADDSAARLVAYARQHGAVVTSVEGGDRLEDSPASRKALVQYLNVARLRMDTCAVNIVNINTTRDAQGKPAPYRRRLVVMTAAGEAEIRVDDSPFSRKYEPGHPDADAEGFVKYSNVDMSVEYVDALEALNDYELATATLQRFDPTIVIVRPNSQQPLRPQPVNETR